MSFMNLIGKEWKKPIRVEVTKNSLPLQKGDLLSKWGKKFRKVKHNKMGKFFVVVAANNEDGIYVLDKGVLRVSTSEINQIQTSIPAGDTVVSCPAASPWTHIDCEREKINKTFAKEYSLEYLPMDPKLLKKGSEE